MLRQFFISGVSLVWPRFISLSPCWYTPLVVLQDNRMNEKPFGVDCDRTLTVVEEESKLPMALKSGRNAPSSRQLLRADRRTHTSSTHFFRQQLGDETHPFPYKHWACLSQWPPGMSDPGWRYRSNHQEEISVTITPRTAIAFLDDLQPNKRFPQK
jgi:hypothetical protein